MATAAAACIAATGVAAPSARAQPPRAPAFVTDIIGVREGMPDPQVSAVTQTTDGYYWLGTRRGLTRYDGLSFTAFTPVTTPELPSATVNALLAEPDGRLWISTDKGLVVREGRRFRRIAASEIPAKVTWEVLRDRKGRLWVAGAFGLRVGDGTRFRSVPGIDRHLYAIAEDGRGRIWVGGRGYLATVVDPDTPARVAPFGADDRFFDLVSDGLANVWVGTRHGVTRFDARGDDPFRVLQQVSSDRDGELAQVWALARDARGDIWLGTDSRGVLRLDGNEAVTVGTDPPRHPDAVWSLAVDRRGRVWAGTSGGLIRYQRSPFHTVTEGLGTRSTWSIRRDDSGTVWATTDEGQLWWLDGERWQPMFRGLRNRMPLSTWPRRDGGLYVADDAGRLFIATRNGLQDVTTRYRFPAEGPLGMYEDTDGALWASTHAGVQRVMQGGTAPMYEALQLTASDEPRVITRDARGRLLVANPWITIVEQGVPRRLGVREGLTDPDVMAMFADGARTWIGTADSGLYVMQQDRVRPLSHLHPALRRDIHGITVDRRGNLWLTSSSGLLRVSSADVARALAAPANAPAPEIRVREFNRLDGLASNDLNADYQSELLQDSLGGLWLPTAGGPVYFQTETIADDTIAPQVHLEQVFIDGHPHDAADTLRLDDHPTRVDVTFAATNALIPERVRAEYRVMGVDTAWTALGRRRTISFGPLDGGTYRVEVRVAAEDGDWNRAVARAALVVPLAWYERPWAFPLFAVAGAVGLWVLVRVRLAAAHERERALEAVVADRTAALAASRDLLEVRVQERTTALANELAERSRLEQRLASARKMESLGRLAGGVSHEINNALATVLGFAQLARGGANGNPAMQADIDEVVRAGRRAANITHQLLAFARQQHTPMRRVRVDTMVREMVRALEQLLGDDLTLHLRIAEDLPPVLADPGQIEQLVVNLVRNARDAHPRDGTVTIVLDAASLDAARAVGDHVLPAGRYLTLAVIDSGDGIAPEALEHLFEPFYTTKDLAAGTGLGLAVCQGIVARHLGAIEVESVVGVQTCFRAWLPAHDAPADAEPPRHAQRGGTETILLVEDEPGIRAFAVRMLAGAGYRVLDAEDGAAALRLIGKSIESIDGVLTDVVMPGVTGLELARLLRATRADLPIVFTSGFAGLEDAALQEMRTIGPMIAKPFTQEELLATLRRELDRRQAEQPA